MKQGKITCAGREIPVHSYRTIVVGTGAAGYNGADCLYQYGQTDIAVVTENRNSGTSRNTGSDKQTYYKLSLSGAEPDSVMRLAEILQAGKCVDGDLALCEAACSTTGFLKLASLGVPFPMNRYGEYIGYKTDHDPGRRATSAGPYTSRYMTQCLEQEVWKKKIPIYDGFQIIRILADQGEVKGLLCLNRNEENNPDSGSRYQIFACSSVIFAVGGPAGIYQDSVYPLGHYGSSGLAFEAGAAGQNVTEWQYGLASVKPRWNVSGTYMQAMPQFISVREDGSDPREFLLDYFSSREEMLSMIFLKGYQWPFDVRKIREGSSMIDLCVYEEIKKKHRRVFLDYRKNSGNQPIQYDQLIPEAEDYLRKAGACFGTPLERLSHMNQPAVDFYQEHGVDLGKDMLEIALCAQHNNGGLAVDCWWQTDLKGLFAAGEVAGTHGVCRPGGTALNAGQVGSMRAARYIAARRTEEPEISDLQSEEVLRQIQERITMGEAILERSANSGIRNIPEIWKETTAEMSRVGAAIRDPGEISARLAALKTQLEEYGRACAEKSGLRVIYRLYDILLCQYVYLSGMEDYVRHGGKSRGSSLYLDPEGEGCGGKLNDSFRFRLDEGTLDHQIQEVVLENGQCRCIWRKERPIPREDDFFENVWRSYRENGNID